MRILTCWLSGLLACFFAVAQDPSESLLLLPPRADPGPYVPVATKFTPTADYLTHTGSYTGSADSKQLTISFWFKVNDAGQNSTDRMLYHITGNVINLIVEDGTHNGASTANDLYFAAEDSGATFNCRFVTTATFAAATNWHHFIMSVDVSTAAACPACNRFVYIDGVADLAPASANWLAFADSAFFFLNSNGDQAIAATIAGANSSAVTLSEVWIAYGQYIDISVAGNLQKFRSVTGHPVRLGASGETPTGTAPTVYLPNPAATFNVNAGTGGNFTIHGAPADDASIP